jgi:hypothetical protein
LQAHYRLARVTPPSPSAPGPPCKKTLSPRSSIRHSIGCEGRCEHENHDRDRRLASANQRRRPHAGQTADVARPLRPRRAHAHAARFSQRRLPDVPGDPPVAVAGKRLRAEASRRVRSAGAAHRDRRDPWVGARRYCLRNGLRFTTSYHTQFPQYLRARFPFPLAVLLLGAAPLPRRGRALHGQHRRCAPISRRAASRISRAGAAAWTPICSNPGSQGFSRSASADRGLCRPGRGREEHRGVPEDALGRQQDRHRRRSGARAPRGATRG